jgi:hypothetical protein
MLSRMERTLLYWLARYYAAGDAIVDAGSFLGGSTVALLAGVADRVDTARRPPVVSYDRFRVEAYTISKFFANDQGVRIGDSFRERFDGHVARFDVPHIVHEGNIVEIGWNGGSIDVLFLDVLKSWKINDAVLREFFPSLVPGRSVVIHQDYGWGGFPWIPISVELLRDSLVLVDWMEWGSHVFFVERELPTDVLERGVGVLDFDTKFHLMERAIARSDGWVRGMLELDRTSLVVARDGEEAALRDLASVVTYNQGHGSVLECAATIRADLSPANRWSWRSRFENLRRRITAAQSASF